MRMVFLACAGAVLVSAPAWACRGTAEFPEVEMQLAMADISDAERDAHAERLQEGIALHDQGHELDSMELRQKSLEILDGIKAELGI